MMVLLAYFNLKNAIAYAKADSKISGIYLDVSMFQGGISRAKRDKGIID